MTDQEDPDVLLTTEDVEVGAQKYVSTSATHPFSCPSPWPAARAVAANRKGHGDRWRPGAVSMALPRRPAWAADQHHTADAAAEQPPLRPNQARSTALFHLATAIPAAILARTLGIGIGIGIGTDVAVDWQRLSAGDWATYAAEVSQLPVRTDQRPASNT
ncbi:MULTISPECIES: hypothetical protein [Streptomyces]|uniref:Uncharacterized protein n=2 Tax=Streptomyces TaxID=1883 RepID=A0ABV9IXY5_9ACTN